MGIHVGCGQLGVAAERNKKRQAYQRTGCVLQLVPVLVLVLLLLRSEVRLAQQEAHERPAEHDRKKLSHPVQSATLGYCILLLAMSQHPMVEQPHTHFCPRFTKSLFVVFMSPPTRRGKGVGLHMPLLPAPCAPRTRYLRRKQEVC